MTSAPTGTLSDTARRAVDAYGGSERWQAAKSIEARATLTGTLFRMKWRMPRPDAEVRCEVHRPFTRIAPIDSDGNVGVLDGLAVRLETASGDVLEERPHAKHDFKGHRRRVSWDSLDLTYFLGYAFWNYFALPALLLRDDVEWRELEPGVLESRFPPELPTHAVPQHHTFDRETGLLERYDYKPDLVMMHPIENVANVVKERGEFDGIVYDAHRIAYLAPKRGKPWTHPVMVDMRFSDWRLT